ncbi:DUF4326 domain-containing protein [Spirulina sp. CS-785/01]|uniref:DUF4326 domain-containing protein n=1 Tax=Spirulina sp. CS-785/01 TaxID=3021716 RepID=UPI00232D6C70|nr:DUF4326 domain-containing protein [Spirulina sp. CS-785/01]MDB9315611.1 DUF4326 domain-containing protein [Spirulina sp. CS-785/01]
MNLQLMNGKVTGFVGKNKIYIGRENRRYQLAPSPLANPYVIGRDGNRTEIIAKYRLWLWHNIQHWQKTRELNPVIEELLNICERLSQGQSLIFTCWCSPKACHGEVLIRCVHWMMQQDFTS